MATLTEARERKRQMAQNRDILLTHLHRNGIQPPFEFEITWMGKLLVAVAGLLLLTWPITCLLLGSPAAAFFAGIISYLLFQYARKIARTILVAGDQMWHRTGGGQLSEANARFQAWEAKEVERMLDDPEYVKRLQDAHSEDLLHSSLYEFEHNNRS